MNSRPVVNRPFLSNYRVPDDLDIGLKLPVTQAGWVRRLNRTVKSDFFGGTGNCKLVKIVR